MEYESYCKPCYERSRKWWSWIWPCWHFWRERSFLHKCWPCRFSDAEKAMRAANR